MCNGGCGQTYKGAFSLNKARGTVVPRERRYKIPKAIKVPLQPEDQSSSEESSEEESENKQKE